MKKTKEKVQLSSKDLEKLSKAACIKAVLIDGKWVLAFNKLENKTYH